MLKKLWKQWMRLAHILGRINTTIVLSALFILFITPLGLVFRLLGKSPFREKTGAGWIKRAEEPSLDKPY